MYFRIVIPPPPDTTWEIGHALRVFEDTADLFDQPEANRIAVEILNGNPLGTNPSSGPTCAEDGRMQCKGADLCPHDIDIPMTNPPPEYRRRLRPEHDGTLQWLLDLGQIFATEAEEEVHEEPMLYVRLSIICAMPFAEGQDLCDLKGIPSRGLTTSDVFGQMCWNGMKSFLSELSDRSHPRNGLQTMHAMSSLSKV